MREKLHQRNLRTGRVSIPGVWYAITTCIAGRRPILIADPFRPVETGRGVEVVLGSVRWLHDQKRWQCHGYCVMPEHVHVIAELQKG
jgi:REP element-mobilizing transposase RayT